MPRLSDRDLRALRAGIREQERADLEHERFQAEFDRHLRREFVDRANLIPVTLVVPGDRVVATDNGSDLYRLGTVTEADLRGEHFWFKINCADGGTEGRTLRRTDRLLIEQVTS